MPRTLICVNGHRTTVRDELVGQTVRCPECGEPASADHPTAALSETPHTPGAVEAAEPPAPPARRAAREPAGRRWARRR